MSNIWSENKYVNLLVNCLMFLVGINFFHYGQLFLPIICLILFIDHKLAFKVNNPGVFILLCLFGVSFYGFSYQLGFYSVMGFTLPMAYYIGSNLKDKNVENVRKVIYLLALGMGTHLILNSIYELIVHELNGFLFSSSHYDIWTRQKKTSTMIAIDLDLLIACLYYLLFHEKDKRIKNICIGVFVLGMSYLIIIGRRTQSILLLLLLGISFVYETFFLKIIGEKQKKAFIRISSIVLSVILVLLAIYSFDLFGMQTVMDEFRIVMKLKESLIGDERFNALFKAISLMPKYLFGGQQISKAMELEVHNFWLDIYDYAGIVPFVLILVYSIYCFMNMSKIIRNSKCFTPFNTLVLGLLACFFIQLNLEPAMTGASIFVIVVVFICTLLEGLVHD